MDNHDYLTTRHHASSLELYGCSSGSPSIMLTSPWHRVATTSTYEHLLAMRLEILAIRNFSRIGLGRTAIEFAQLPVA